LNCPTIPCIAVVAVRVWTGNGLALPAARIFAKTIPIVIIVARA
jgi:hypothetical protein